MNTPETPLQSWKEIGAYLQRDATTARRWEKDEGLPVHRHSHKTRSSVYAYPGEIDSWRASRRVAPESTPARPLWKIPAFAVTLVLCLIMVGNGIRPAEAQGAKATAKRLLCSGDCADTEANLSTDGRTMVLTDWDTGDIAIRNVKTGQQHRLMARSGSYDDKGDSGAYGEKPLFSPDMRQIAYFWAPEKNKSQLRVMANAPGGQSRVLVENPEYDYFGAAAWSPDGKSVLVNVRKKSDRTWQLAWVSVSDGIMKPVASLEWRNLGELSLSPDGRYIVYAARAINPKAANSKEPADVHIYLVASDGSRTTELVKTAGMNANPIWTPDGKHVLFVSDQSGTRALWSIAVRDGKPEGAAALIRSDMGDATGVGIRGGTYYYAQKATGIEYVSFVGMTPAGMKSLEPTREGFVGMQPKWSPDGTSISFKRHHQGSTDTFDLVVHSVDTGDEKMYLGNVPVQNRPDWFYDGRSMKVAFPENVYRIDVQTGERSLLPSGGFLSPADPTLYHLKAAADGRLTQIVAVDSNTGQERVVWTLTKANAVFISGTGSLTRDGKTVTFIVRDQDGNHFASVRADGTGYREVPVPTMASNAHAWTADGRSILFIEKQNDKSRFMRISAEGGKPEFTGVEVAGNVQSWDVSPDGALAYNTNKTVWELWAIDNIASALK